MFGDRYFGKRYFGNRYFGPGADSAPAFHQSGGGFYRQPIKFVRDGKVVDLNESAPAPVIEEWPELSPGILAALAAGFQSPPIQLPDAAALEARLSQILIDRQASAMRDDDDAVCLLLLA